MLRSSSAQLAQAPESSLGGSSLPFGRPKRCKPCSWGFKLARGRHDSCKLCAAAPHLANALPWPPTVPAESFLGGSSVPFGSAERCKPCAAAPHSFHKRCRGHQLCRQSLFWGVQACRLAGLKGVNPALRLRTTCAIAAVATNCAGRVFSWGFKFAVWQA